MRSSIPSALGFRTDVQGIRALAVLAVIAYHFKLGLNGGFLGVDIFFVVSGFVVAGVLLRELRSSGTIQFGRFILRRLFRLLPALAVVVTITTLVEFFFFTSDEVKRLVASTGPSAILGVSNFWIAQASGGYFAPDAERNPLLHTWSLSVEWQFYIFLMLAIWGYFAVSKGSSQKDPLGLFIGLSAVSFGATFINAEIGFFEIGGFYSALPRAWEFLIGAVIYIASSRYGLSPGQSKALGIIGLAAILFSLYFYSENLRTPGPLTAIVVIGTALLIFSGSNPSAPTARLFAWKPLVVIGDMSYSLYLWHWPIYVFWVQFGLTRNPEARHLVLLLTLTFIASWISWAAIERPFRGSIQHLKFSRTALAITGVIPLTIFLALASLGPGLVQELSGSEGSKKGDVGHDEFHAFVEAQYFPCDVRPPLSESNPYWNGFLRCQQSKSTSPHTIALIGDSHAEHLFAGLAAALPHDNVLYLFDGNLPISGESDRMDQILDFVSASPTIQTVIVTAFWEEKGVPADRLGTTISLLQSAGKEVFLTNDIPTAKNDPERCRARPSIISPEPSPADCVSGVSEPKLQQNEDALKALAEQQGLKLIDTYHQFCELDGCSISSADNSTVYYRDRNHLNIPGSNFVGEFIAQEIEPH